MTRAQPRPKVGARHGPPILAGYLVRHSIDVHLGETMNRRGEDCAIPFRTGRFFTIGHNWYVATRDDRDLGPFPTRDRARQALAHYLASQAVSIIEEDDGSPVTGSHVSTTMVSEFGLFLEHLNKRGHSAAIAWASARKRQIEDDPLPPDEKRERLAALGLILEQF